MIIEQNLMFKVLKYVLSNNWIEKWKERKYPKELFRRAQRTEVLRNKIIVFNTIKKEKAYIHSELFLGKILALSGAKVYLNNKLFLNLRF